MATNRRKNAAAASFMSGFGKKVNATEEVKVEEKVEEVASIPAEVLAAEAEVPAKQEEQPVAVEEKAEPVAVMEPKEEAPVKIEEKVVEEAIKEDTKVKEKMVSYNFHIPYKLVKRLNRVIDEMKENDVKMLKKDFIVLAVEKLVDEYERKYDVK